ncbi:hypothetical protein SESBI_19501 [Sesbania bispinosa]|nr:hypothetical protein SESBI_19501 [Sesbania bispinosa]
MTLPRPTSVSSCRSPRLDLRRKRPDLFPSFSVRCRWWFARRRSSSIRSCGAPPLALLSLFTAVEGIQVAI